VTPHTTSAASQGRVLLVEDDPDAALFFTRVLTRRGGFDVTHQPDPHAALDLARRERWDLVVTDYELPGMTGLDLLAGIRECAPALPVVLVTACGECTLPPPPPAPDALLSKPVPPVHLITTAAALTARHSTVCDV
jgi:CheY-like chemotaxis protein